MKSTRSRFISISLSVLLFLTHSVLIHAAEVNVWSERRAGAAAHSPVQLAGLPAALPPLRRTLFSPTGSASPAPEPAQGGDIILPADLGSLKTVRSSSDYTVIYLQDVHLNAEAQSHLGQAVTSLLERKAVDLIALEGAFGPIDVAPFRAFSNQAAFRKALNYFKRNRRLSGPAESVFTSAIAPPPVIGIDDRRLYAANVRAMRASQADRKTAAVKIGSLVRQTATEKRSVYSAELSQLDQRLTGFRSGTLSLGDFARSLYDASPQSTRVEARFQTVRRFLAAVALEDAIDFKRVDAERGHALARLVERADKKALDDLLRATLAYKHGEIPNAAFYRTFCRLLTDNAIDIARFPAMERYIRYVTLAEELDAAALLPELDALTEAAAAALIRTERERSLWNRSNAFGLATKLIERALTPADWEAYQRYAPALSSETRQGLAAFEDFYVQAIRRDAAIAKNVDAWVRKTGARRVALVAGGFHSDGVFRQLQGRPTIVRFTPRLTRLDPVKDDLYLGAFAQRLPVEQLLEGERLFLSPAPAPDRLELALVTAIQAAHDGSDFTGALTEMAPELKPGGLSPTVGEEDAVLPFPQAALTFEFEDGEVETIRLQPRSGGRPWMRSVAGMGVAAGIALAIILNWDGLVLMATALRHHPAVATLIGYVAGWASWAAVPPSPGRNAFLKSDEEERERERFLKIVPFPLLPHQVKEARWILEALDEPDQTPERRKRIEAWFHQINWSSFAGYLAETIQFSPSEIDDDQLVFLSHYFAVMDGENVDVLLNTVPTALNLLKGGVLIPASRVDAELQLLRVMEVALNHAGFGPRERAKVVFDLTRFFNDRQVTPEAFDEAVRLFSELLDRQLESEPHFLIETEMYPGLGRLLGSSGSLLLTSPRSFANGSSLLFLFDQLWFTYTAAVSEDIRDEDRPLIDLVQAFRAEAEKGRFVEGWNVPADADPELYQAFYDHLFMGGRFGIEAADKETAEDDPDSAAEEEHGNGEDEDDSPGGLSTFRDSIVLAALLGPFAGAALAGPGGTVAGLAAGSGFLVDAAWFGLSVLAIYATLRTVRVLSRVIFRHPFFFAAVVALGVAIALGGVEASSLATLAAVPPRLPGRGSEDRPAWLLSALRLPANPRAAALRLQGDTTIDYVGVLAAFLETASDDQLREALTYVEREASDAGASTIVSVSELAAERLDSALAALLAAALGTEAARARVDRLPAEGISRRTLLKWGTAGALSASMKKIRLFVAEPLLDTPLEEAAVQKSPMTDEQLVQFLRENWTPLDLSEQIDLYGEELIKKWGDEGIRQFESEWGTEEEGAFVDDSAVLEREVERRTGRLAPGDLMASAWTMNAEEYEAAYDWLTARALREQRDSEEASELYEMKLPGKWKDLLGGLFGGEDDGPSIILPVSVFLVVLAGPFALEAVAGMGLSSGSFPSMLAQLVQFGILVGLTVIFLKTVRFAAQWTVGQGAAAGAVSADLLLSFRRSSRGSPLAETVNAALGAPEKLNFREIVLKDHPDALTPEEVAALEKLEELAERLQDESAGAEALRETVLPEFKDDSLVVLSAAYEGRVKELLPAIRRFSGRNGMAFVVAESEALFRELETALGETRASSRIAPVNGNEANAFEAGAVFAGRLDAYLVSHPDHGARYRSIGGLNVVKPASLRWVADATLRADSPLTANSRLYALEVLLAILDAARHRPPSSETLIKALKAIRQNA